jgi:hypothetical protein
LFQTLTPFFNRSSNVGENTKELNYGLNSPGSLTNRITQINKVCIILKGTMRNGHVKNSKLKKGKKIGSIPSWRGPLN